MLSYALIKPLTLPPELKKASASLCKWLLDTSFSLPLASESIGASLATDVVAAAFDSVTVAVEEVVAVLDVEELLARRLAANFAKSLRSAAFANGDREPDGPDPEEDAVPEGVVLAAAINFW